jgi:aminotransferase
MQPIDLGLGHVRIAAGENARPDTAAREYGPAAGYPALREAVAGWENVAPEDVAITTGASLALVATLATLPRPCSVLCPRPYYPAYPAIASAMGLELAFYDLEPERGWLPAPGALTRCTRSDTRALLWNFPGNPTGSLPSAALIDEVREIVSRQDLLVVSDEVYAEFIYGPALPSARGAFGTERVVRVRSFSKAFEMPGERLGYVVADPSRSAMISRAHWALAMCPPASSQAHGLRALGADAASRLAVLKARLTANRDSVSRILAECSGVRFHVPEAGIFYWIEVVDSPIGSQHLAQACAAAGVTVMPGTAFGVHGPTYIRASFAVPEQEALEGFEALVRFVRSMSHAQRSPTTGGAVRRHGKGTERSADLRQHP